MKGRPPALSPAQIKEALEMYDSGARPKDLSKKFGIHRKTARKYLRAAGKPPCPRGQDFTTRPKVRKLRERGYSDSQIADILGIKTNTVYNHITKLKTGRPDYHLNREAWIAFVETLTTRETNARGGTEALYINGERLNDNLTRTYHAWRTENRGVSIFRADLFLTRVSVPLQHFFDWCEHEGLDPWADEPPEWEV